MARSKKEREEIYARWLASGAPEAQQRLQAALQSLGVDVSGITMAFVKADNNGKLWANIVVGGVDLDALIEALERK